jgi:hypothetical protein
MKMRDESVPPLSATMLRRLEVAEIICSCAASLATQGNVQRREKRLELTRRDRVAIGLTLKVERSLRALMDDCRAQRSEAMHHLKTMAECLIYFYAVLHDQSETTARQLLAKVLKEEATFCRENPSKGGPTEAAAIEAQRAQVGEGLGPLPDLATLAARAKVQGWYSRVYRQACEPSHMGDVFEFMPLGDDPISVGGQPGLSAVRASDALWYGGQIALSMMRSICESTDLDLHAPVDELERQFAGSAEAEVHDPPPQPSEREELP